MSTFESTNFCVMPGVMNDTSCGFDYLMLDPFDDTWFCEDIDLCHAVDSDASSFVQALLEVDSDVDQPAKRIRSICNLDDLEPLPPAGMEAAELDSSTHSTMTDKSSSSTRSGSSKCCAEPGCFKFPQGRTAHCIAHGGGRRCTVPGCTKGARDKFFCVGHGGGKRCSIEACTKSAVGGSSVCSQHGGGRKCTFEGCSKSAQSATKFCVHHGGGKTCNAEGCTKVARGRTDFCSAHGGGPRCEVSGCGKATSGKKKFCRMHCPSEEGTAPVPMTGEDA